MAITSADLEALDDCIKTGRLRVRYSDKEITYRSMNELLAARSFIATKLGIDTAPPSTQGRHIRAVTRTGF